MLSRIAVAVCCFGVATNSGSAEVWGQAPGQFRSPEIPALRALGGRLISAPTKPQTTLQTLTQENQLRSLSARPQESSFQESSFPQSKFQEYQFGSETAGQFEELSAQAVPAQALNQNRLPFDNQIDQQGLQSGPVAEDLSFNGFTPRGSQGDQYGSPELQTFDSQESDSQNYDPEEFDSGNLRKGISEFFNGRRSSGDGSGTRQTEDSMEQLPPAMNETQSGSSGRADKIIQRFPNGKKRIVRTVAQDEKGNFSNHGPWEAFDLNGKSVAAGVFKRGIMQGQWRRQHDQSEEGLLATKPFNLYQGPYLSVANFKDGKLNGLWTIYDRFRSKIFEITYSKGVRNGTATWWYPNRAKMREATFKDGLLNGMILGWDDSEKLTRREEYVEGRKIVRNVTFYRPKKPKQEEYFLDSKLEPEGEDSWWDAKPTPYLQRGSKVQNGGAAQWYENGQLKHQGQFKEGEPVGRFVWWHANGNKSIQGMYADGIKTRTWTWWHENGMKKTEGAYEDDRPVGDWRAWYADGSLRNEETFPAVGDLESESQLELPQQEEEESAETTEDLAGKSVIESNPTEMEEIDQADEVEEVPDVTEELPTPLPQTVSPEQTDSTSEIEGLDFGKQKSDVGSESFRDPIDPRDIDPFGEIDIEEDGSIPDEHFKQPESNLFRTPGPDFDSPPKPDSQPVSDPFSDKFFKTPPTEDLTAGKPKNAPAAIKR